MKPLVSIVIPTYNRADDLRRSLRSVLSQTYPCWETIVVDNHSNDDTNAVIQEFKDSRIQLLKIHNNGVVAASRNMGIRQASGKYIALLDSDDWWKPAKLEKSVETLEHDADIVYHDLCLVTCPGQKIFLKNAKTRDLQEPVFEDLLAGGNALTNSSVVVRGDILKKLNGFSEDRDLIAIEDYDCWLRVAQLTDRFRRIPETLGYYWAGGGNLSHPERTLKTLSAIEKKYADRIHAMGFNGTTGWIRYARGQACYRLGSYAEATKEFQGLIFGKADFWLKMKSLCLLALASLHSLPGLSKLKALLP